MPKGVWNRNKDNIEAIPVADFQKPEPIKEVKADTMASHGIETRRYSKDTDSKGEGHPLCMNCGHREDMHHEWDVENHMSERKNPMTGVVMEHRWKTKTINNDRSHPCQHACKCTEYK